MILKCTMYIVITDYKGILQLHVPTPVLEGLHIWEVFGSRCEGFVRRTRFFSVGCEERMISLISLRNPGLLMLP